MAGNRKREVTYRLEIRQHKVEPDSTAWHLRSSVSLPFTPTAFALLTDGQILYHLATNGDAGGMLSTSSDGRTWAHPLPYDDDAAVTSAQLVGGKIIALTQNGASSLELATDNLAAGWQAQATPATLTDLLGTIADSVYATDGTAIYKYAEGTWSQVTLQEPLPIGFPAYGAARISFKNRIFAYGGFDRENQPLSSAFSTMGSGSYWTSVLNKSTGPFDFGVRTGATAVYYLKRVYLIGGNATDTNLPTKQVYLSCDEGFSWEKAEKNLYLPDAFAARSSCAAVVFNNSIWICGGRYADGAITTDVWEGHMNRADFLIQ